MRIRFFLKEVHRRSSLKQFLYLVVVGVETLDDVDTEEDVDTELEVEALKTIIYIKKKEIGILWLYIYSLRNIK